TRRNCRRVIRFAPERMQETGIKLNKLTRLFIKIGEQASIAFCKNCICGRFKFSNKVIDNQIHRYNRFRGFK
uniref:hypothetical protein n=1 Tax=Hafnia alvei TaxID=569 RepID=UPI00248E5753